MAAVVPAETKPGEDRTPARGVQTADYQFARSTDTDRHLRAAHPQVRAAHPQGFTASSTVKTPIFGRGTPLPGAVVNTPELNIHKRIDCIPSQTSSGLHRWTCATAIPPPPWTVNQSGP